MFIFEYLNSEAKEIRSYNVSTNDERAHLLDTTTHGSASNIPHIPTLMHMIVHAHIKQIIGLVPGIVIHVIIRPGKSVTMDRTLTIVVITGEERVPRRIDKVIVRGIAQIHHTQIRVVTRILIDTVVIVSLGTVTIVVVRLTILRPAALGGLNFTLIEVELSQFIWPNEGFTTGKIVVRFDIGCICLEHLFWRGTI